MLCSLFEVGAQTSVDVLPGGEGAGKLYLQLVGDIAVGAEHEVVGVDVARLPGVERMVGAVEFILHGDIRERLVERAVSLVEQETHRETYVLLRYLHDAVLAQHEIGRLLCLAFREVVARHVPASVEAEELEPCGGGMGNSLETRGAVGRVHTPAGVGVIRCSRPLARGLVARGRGGEVVGGHLYSEVLYI